MGMGMGRFLLSFSLTAAVDQVWYPSLLRALLRSIDCYFPSTISLPSFILLSFLSKAKEGIPTKALV